MLLDTVFNEFFTFRVDPGRSAGAERRFCSALDNESDRFSRLLRFQCSLGQNVCGTADGAATVGSPMRAGLT